MREIKKIFIIISVVLIFTIVFSACRATNPDDFNEQETNINTEGFDYELFNNIIPEISLSDELQITDYIAIAQNDTLILYFKPENTAIAVRDKRNNYIWHSQVGEELHTSEGLNRFLSDSFESLIVMRYIEINLNNLTTKIEAVQTHKPEIATQAIENGVRIKYEMESIGVHIVVEVSINEDKLIVNVPAKGLREEVGATEWVMGRLDTIKQFVEDLDEVIREMRSDSQLRFIRSEVNTVIRMNTELRRIVFSINDALGLDDLADRARAIANSMIIEMRGGSGVLGLIRSVRENEQIQQESKDYYISKLSALDDRLDMITLLMAQLKTKSVASIVGLDVLPYFGAAKDTDSGYMFFPDGSGAISYFKEDRPVSTSDYYSVDTFSDWEVDIDWERVRDRAGMQRAFIPVFGVKNGDNAYVATVSDGISAANINYYPSGFMVGLNRTFAGFHYRNVIESASSSGVYTGFSGRRYERIPFGYDNEVTFMFLVDDDADYSGMANRYRDYLLKNDLLGRSQLISDKHPVVIDLLMGITEDRLLLDKFIPMTTFEDAVNLLDYLNENRVENVILNLHGWTKEGYNRYPSSNKVSNALGGRKGLNELMEKAKSMGVKVYLQDNYIEAYSRITKVENKDLAYGSDGRIFRNSNLSINIFSPSRKYNQFTKELLPDISKLGVDGITFDRLGTMIYLDYQPQEKYQRKDTIFYYQKMLEDSKNTLGGSAIIGGNLYALKNSDFLINIPDGSTKYLFADESIPFYQMVVYGSIPYTSSMFNQFYDPEFQTLKMIEYGSIPYFNLTSLPASELKYAGHDILFSSMINEWKGDIVTLHDAYATRLQSISNAYFTLHKRLNNSVVLLEYSNGAQVYLNYSVNTIEIAGHIIDGLDYIVVEGGTR